MEIDTKMRSHLGDAGHMMRSFRAIYANNPDGRPFSVKLHRYMWPDLWEKDFAMVICDPAGVEIARGEIGGEQESITVDVVPGATGGKGVYSIRLTKEGAHEVWLQCSLEQLVLDCGDWEQRSGRDETFDLYPIGMPRRWYFFVPEGVNEFRVSCAHGSAHRQDSGMVVCTPAWAAGGRDLWQPPPRPGQFVHREVQYDAALGYRRREPARPCDAHRNRPGQQRPLLVHLGLRRRWPLLEPAADVARRGARLPGLGARAVVQPTDRPRRPHRYLRFSHRTGPAHQRDLLSPPVRCSETPIPACAGAT